MAPVTRPVLGLILAGGAARRMGGGDKPLRMLGGRTILSRVAERLGPQCDGLLLSANGDPARFAPLGLAVVPDAVAGGAGPLAGILAGLDRAAARCPDGGWVVVVPGDTPFLPVDLVARLREACARSGARIACAASGGRTHPAVALWDMAMRADLRTAVEIDGERKVGRVLDRLAAVTVDWPVLPVDPFFNVNDPADLRAAHDLLAEVDR